MSVPRIKNYQFSTLGAKHFFQYVMNVTAWTTATFVVKVVKKIKYQKVTRPRLLKDKHDKDIATTLTEYRSCWVFWIIFLYKERMIPDV